MDYNISSEKLEHPLLKKLVADIIPVFQKLEIKFFRHRSNCKGYHYGTSWRKIW